MTTLFPLRLQRRRSTGWKMPEGAVYVGRPTVFGNPFVPSGIEDSRGHVFGTCSGGRPVLFVSPTVWTVAQVVALYRAWLLNEPPPWPHGFVPNGMPRDGSDPRSPYAAIRFRRPTEEEIASLRGHDLACWCPINGPCHADVLLEVANR